MALEIRVSQNLTSSGEGVFKNNGDGGNEMNCATVVFISKNHIFLRILQNSILIFLLENPSMHISLVEKECL